MRIALLCKDSSFEDEREWRLVVGFSLRGGANDVKMLNTVDFRIGGGLVRPYYDFDFRYEGEDLARRLPLRKVRYGPMLRAAGTELSIRFVLDRKGYGGVRAEKSKVPFEA